MDAVGAAEIEGLPGVLAALPRVPDDAGAEHRRTARGRSRRGHARVRLTSDCIMCIMRITIIIA